MQNTEFIYHIVTETSRLDTLIDKSRFARRTSTFASLFPSHFLVLYCRMIAYYDWDFKLYQLLDSLGHLVKQLPENVTQGIHVLLIHKSSDLSSIFRKLFRDINHLRYISSNWEKVVAKYYMIYSHIFYSLYICPYLIDTAREWRSVFIIVG